MKKWFVKIQDTSGIWWYYTGNKPTWSIDAEKSYFFSTKKEATYKAEIVCGRENFVDLRHVCTKEIC